MQIVKILNVNRQLVDLDVVRRVLGVRPSQDSVCGRVKDILSIGAREIGSKWNIERVENRSIGGLRGSHGLAGLNGVLGMIEGIHRHIGTAHSEIGCHSFRPVTHVCQLIHDGGRKSCVVKVVVVVRIVGGDGRPRWRRLDGRGTPEVEKVERNKDAMREGTVKRTEREKGIEEAWARNGWGRGDKGKGKEREMVVFVSSFHV